MRILVTGATGRVGQRVTPRLLARGDTVRVLARQPERVTALEQLGAEIAVGDLRQPDTLAQAVESMDAIIHLAAFFRSPDEAQVRAVNDEGTVALARAAIQAGVPRFVFTSTNLVYGSTQGGPAHEDDAVQPVQAYPASKVAAEQALLALNQGTKLGLRILRLAFVYGEGDPHLAEGLTWFRNWHPATRFQMVHHADVSQALLLAIDAPLGDGRIYNVADDQPVSAGELLHFFGEPISPDATTRPLDNSWAGLVDTTRIKAELGFRPLYPSFYTARDAGTL
jgi:nucleoside-diphosphate-sugar epimerase